MACTLNRVLTLVSTNFFRIGLNHAKLKMIRFLLSSVWIRDLSSDIHSSKSLGIGFVVEVHVLLDVENE